MSVEYFKTELDKLPSFEVYRQNLSTLGGLNLEAATPKEIGEAFYEHAGILWHETALLGEGILNKLPVFRSRLKIDEQVEDTTLLRAFSYPSPAHCKERGRANLANRPVFYASDVFAGAIAECRPNVGDAIHVSMWEFDCPRKVHYRILLPTTIPETNLWHKAASNHARFLTETVAKEHPDKHDHIVHLCNWVSNLFITERKPYPITSWISSGILYDFDGIDFIVYPSVAAGQVVCSLAFHPNFIDMYAQLKAVGRFTVQSIEGIGANMRINFRTTSVGSVERTQIHWERPNDKNVDWIPGRLKQPTG